MYFVYYFGITKNATNLNTNPIIMVGFKLHSFNQTKNHYIIFIRVRIIVRKVCNGEEKLINKLRRAGKTEQLCFL